MCFSPQTHKMVKHSSSANCQRFFLSVFEHFVGLALKGISGFLVIDSKYSCNTFIWKLIRFRYVARQWFFFWYIQNEIYGSSWSVWRKMVWVNQTTSLFLRKGVGLRLEGFFSLLYATFSMVANPDRCFLGQTVIIAKLHLW